MSKTTSFTKPEGVYLKSLLHNFGESTGLRVNYHKSYMVPLNVPETKIQELSSIFGCQIASMPFTYLGIPMGTTKPRMDDLTPLMDRIERRLNACSVYLSYSGRLEMVNTVLTSTATYAMCSIKLPVGVIENIDRIRKQCLWRGNNPEKKGGNLAAWHLVQKPKEKGGLGILNLRLQNEALLLKQLGKFYNRFYTPWVNLIWNRYYQHKVPHASSEVGSLWWKDILRLQVLFRGTARCVLGNGAITFWETFGVMKFYHTNIHGYSPSLEMKPSQFSNSYRPMILTPYLLYQYPPRHLWS
jgi:hypothetical protein